MTATSGLSRFWAVFLILVVYAWVATVLVAATWSHIHEPSFGLDALWTSLWVGGLVAVWTLPLASFFAYFAGPHLMRWIRGYTTRQVATRKQEPV